MKKILNFSAAIIGLLAIAGYSQAQEVSVQFMGNNGALGSTPAGVDGATDWNTLALDNGSNYLGFAENDPATMTGSYYDGIGVSLFNPGWVNNTGVGTIPLDPGSTSLLSNGSATLGAGNSFASADVSLTLTGLNSGDLYDLIVYVGGGPSELGVSKLTLSGAATSGNATFYYETPGGDGGNSGPESLINQSTTTNLASELTAGSGDTIGEGYESTYIEFDNIQGSSLNVDLTELGAFPFGSWAPNGDTNGNLENDISGFQLFDIGPGAATPEPASVWLFSFGLLGLGFQIWRKRPAKV